MNKLLQLNTAQILCKGVLALSIGLFGILVASGNLLDYQSNWQFVQHVLAMDKMESWFEGSVLQQRAIHNPTVQTVFYIGIIIGEALFGLLCTLGGLLILSSLFKDKIRYLTFGKISFTLGALMAILVWYTGFAVIGGEYFAMWANKWNGQMKAYAFISFILLSLMYISQAEQQ
ncbi:DUF2165 domain-containing protein [Iodobacter sp. CM08]|uniref:DUF2165 domain-containing protein n=1 Tax=Iodobacter sp. CM08 TaxID=3085902 RepID=UPI002981CE1E|nr:DUF2165 domain-containing protein [Iodobacter sp. CM08]MDW5415782.1 DUF2165 domain-containing protein [Iodobacter sp. CM08]